MVKTLESVQFLGKKVKEKDKNISIQPNFIMKSITKVQL